MELTLPLIGSRAHSHIADGQSESLKGTINRLCRRSRTRLHVTQVKLFLPRSLTGIISICTAVRQPHPCLRYFFRYAGMSAPAVGPLNTKSIRVRSMAKCRLPTAPCEDYTHTRRIRTNVRATGGLTSTTININSAVRTV